MTKYTRHDKAEAIILYMAFTIDSMRKGILSQDEVEEQLHGTFPALIVVFTNQFKMNAKFRALKDEGLTPLEVFQEVYPEAFENFAFVKHGMSGESAIKFMELAKQEMEEIINDVENGNG